jgi:hypothetical protein
MQESDSDIARRALQKALGRLDSNQPHNGDASQVVVVIVGASGGVNSEERTRPSVESEPAVFAGQQSESCHPGLEKFHLSETAAPTRGTKPCFIEPERQCVNSGACEMRGY